MRAIFLVDNGSLRPQATHNLRRVAAALSETLGETVQAASLLHSNKIPAEEVDGIPAITLGPAAERSAEAGATEIIVLPFFFGPSKALTGYLPERMAALQARFLTTCAWHSCWLITCVRSCLNKALPRLRWWTTAAPSPTLPPCVTA